MGKKHRGAQPAMPDIALVVIARDEARCIARCLQSAAAHVRRMLVLDTGSTDATVDIARRCGARVEHLAWTGDFSAARNAALALADADWNLVLDADEWLEAGAQALRGPTLAQPFLGLVTVRSDIAVGSHQAQSRTWLPRLLPRGVRYEGRIHEQPVAGLPRLRLPLVLGHDGYAAEQLAQKAGRNRAILLREIQDHPDDAYVRYQLGKDLEIHREFEPACQEYFRALESAPAQAAWRRDAAVRLMYCLAQSRQFERAIVLSGDLMDDCQDFPDYFFALGNLFLDMAVNDPAQAHGQWLPMVESAWLRCLEIGERPDLDGVLGRGSFLAAHNLAVLYGGLQQAENQRHFENLARQLRQNPAKPAPNS